jgi:hypothetical protein
VAFDPNVIANSLRNIRDATGVAGVAQLYDQEDPIGDEIEFIRWVRPMEEYERIISDNMPVTACTRGIHGPPQIVTAPGHAGYDPMKRWSAQTGSEPADMAPLPQWIFIDFKERMNVTHIIVDWEIAYAKQYRLEVTGRDLSVSPLSPAETAASLSLSMSVHLQTKPSHCFYLTAHRFQMMARHFIPSSWKILVRAYQRWLDLVPRQP